MLVMLSFHHLLLRLYMNVTVIVFEDRIKASRTYGLLLDSDVVDSISWVDEADCVVG